VRPDAADPLVAGGRRSDSVGRAVGGRVVDHDHLVVDALAPQRGGDSIERRADRPRLVVGGDDDRQA
jgi:hypothetical protein